MSKIGKLKSDKTLALSCICLGAKIYGFSKDSLVKLFKENNLELDLNVFELFSSTQTIEEIEQKMNDIHVSANVQETAVTKQVEVKVQKVETPAVDFSSFF